MARNLSLEPALPNTEIQADILVGLLKKHEHLIFFQIVNPPAFKTFLKTLHITSIRILSTRRMRFKQLGTRQKQVANL